MPFRVARVYPGTVCIGIAGYSGEYPEQRDLVARRKWDG